MYIILLNKQKFDQISCPGVTRLQKVWEPLG